MDLLTAHQADLAFTILPILGIVIGIVAAVLGKRTGGNPIASAVQYGGPFVLMGILWRIYGAVAAHLGAASVANLLVDLALFVIIGGVCGMIGKRLNNAPHHRDEGENDGDALAGVTVGPGPTAPSGRDAAAIAGRDS